jgi:hypothetical protein
MRCPFVRAVAAGDLVAATALAVAEPEPADPAVVVWLLGEAQRQLGERGERCAEPGCGAAAAVTAFCPSHWF